MSKLTKRQQTYRDTWKHWRIDIAYTHTDGISKGLTEAVGSFLWDGPLDHPNFINKLNSVAESGRSKGKWTSYTAQPLPTRIGNKDIFEITHDSQYV